VLLDYKLGQGSIVLRVKLRDSGSSSGAGLTGLTSASSGLKISTIADVEATATAYSGANLEAVTTLGTYAAPTSGKARFKEVDATNHPGVYEIQLADARYAVTNAKSVLVSLSGATSLAQCDVLVPLRSVNPYDGVRFGLTALPNAAAEAAGGLYTRGTGAGQINQAANGQVDANLARVLNSAVTEGGAGRLAAAFSTLFDVASPVLTAASVNQTGDAFARIGANGVSLSAVPDLAGVTTLLGRLSAARAGYVDNLNVGGPVASAGQVSSLAVNTRANLNVPVEIETPDSSTQVYKVRLHLFDVEGNMEAPDSTPTVALTNAAGTDRSGRLSGASNPSTGVYTWDYTATAGDAEEQLVWVFTVVEGGLTRTYPATTYVVEESAYRFSSTDRSNLGAIKTKTDQFVFTNANRVDAAVLAAGDFAQAAADKAWNTGARTLTSAANITSTGGTTVPQTGDAYARLGAPVGASVSADVAGVPAKVWDLPTSGHTTSGTFGAAMNAAGSAGDPWGPACRPPTGPGRPARLWGTI
jgi:hypothetical protein